jgi:hypothetical protein
MSAARLGIIREAIMVTICCGMRIAGWFPAFMTTARARPIW